MLVLLRIAAKSRQLVLDLLLVLFLLCLLVVGAFSSFFLHELHETTSIAVLAVVVVLEHFVHLLDATTQTPQPKKRLRWPQPILPQVSRCSNLTSAPTVAFVKNCGQVVDINFLDSSSAAVWRPSITKRHLKHSFMFFYSF